MDLSEPSGAHKSSFRAATTVTEKPYLKGKKTSSILGHAPPRCLPAVFSHTKGGTVMAHLKTAKTLGTSVLLICWTRAKGTHLSFG